MTSKHTTQKPISQNTTNWVTRQNSLKAAKAASSVLRDGRTSSKSKAAAGSALSQTAKSRAIKPSKRK